MLLLRKVVSHEECIILCILEREAGTSCNRPQRVFRNVERNVDLLCKTFCKSPEEGTAAGEMDTVLHDVGVELRRCLLENMDDSALDSRHRLVKAVRNLLMCDCSMYRMGCHKVRTGDRIWIRFIGDVRYYGSDRDLDLLGCNLSHPDVVLLAEVHLDVVGEHVSGHLDGVLHHDASEGDYRDFRCTSSYVNHHVSLWRLYVEADTEG